MYRKNLIIAGLIAISLHAAVILVSLNITSEPEVIFRKGESSLKMNLVPSIASTASTKSTNDTQKNIQNVNEKKMEKPTPLQKAENEIQKVTRKVEEQTIEIPKPVKRPEIPKKEQVRIEDRTEQKKQGITYSTEYFESQKEINNKQSQIQKNNTDTHDSREIIADIKTKGVIVGAVVKNVFKPSYPLSCRRRGHEGITVLEVTILSKGKCGNIEIVKSAGCELLDKAAIKALKKAEYIPAKRLGVPFTSTKKIAFNFKLEDYQ